LSTWVAETRSFVLVPQLIAIEASPMAAQLIAQQEASLERSGSSASLQTFVNFTLGHIFVKLNCITRLNHQNQDRALSHQRKAAPPPQK
jgi:phage terminase large subunit GpA-like protein